jgi:hypothetical protein
MHQCIKFILFWNDTLHASDGLSVHHQVFKTAHTAIGMCQTDTAVCLLASRQQYLFETYLLLYVQSCTPDDGRKDRPKHVVSLQNKIKQTAVSVWQMPVAVCAVLNTWWWKERPSETCRVSFQNKIWYIGASSWFGMEILLKHSMFTVYFWYFLYMIQQMLVMLKMLWYLIRTSKLPFISGL